MKVKNKCSQKILKSGKAWNLTIYALKALKNLEPGTENFENKSLRIFKCNK